MRYSLTRGVAIRLGAGGLWLLVLGSSVAEAWDAVGAAIWTIPAAVTWYVLVTDGAARPPRKPHGGLWWTCSLFGPLSLVLLARSRRGTQPEQQSASVTEAEMSTDALRLRLSAVEDQMRILHDELTSIRAALGAPETTNRLSAPEPATPAPTRAAEPMPPAPVPRAPFPAAQPREAPVTERPPATPPPTAPAREIDFGFLLGPKALALAGGLVMLLGVVFFFVLAVNNGWIGPVARVLCGAAASGIVFAAGLWLRSRFGETHASLAAVGTGIGGAYTTLAAATVLYDLVPTALALVLAAGIATAALAVALAWRSELVAALGLIGAVAAPALLATQGGLTAAGVGFAAIVTAAAAAVAVRLRWYWLLAGAVLASAPQVAALVLTSPRLDGAAIALAIVFALLYLSAGTADQLASGETKLAPLPTLLALASIGLTWLASARLFGPAGGAEAGAALLVAASAFGAIAVALWLRSQRELATLIGTIALAAGAVGAADMLSGANIVYTLAAEGVVLAFAASRVREPRLQVAALAYLVLAGGHALIVDAPPDSLFAPARHPAAGAGALAAVVVAAVAVIRTAVGTWDESGERGVLRFLAPVVRDLRTHQREVRLIVGWVAALFAVDAVSLVVLESFQAAWSDGGVEAAFARGHVAVTGLWSLAGLVAVVLATRRNAHAARLIAFGWLGVTGLKVVAHDGSQLTGFAFSLSFGIVAAALVLAGYLGEVLDRRKELSLESTGAVLVGVAFAVASLFPTHTDSQFGSGLLVIAFLLSTLAASVFTRLRDLATLLWTSAIALVAVAVPLLLDGTWITFAWALGATALASLSVATRERRLLAGALGYLALTAAAAVVHAPPSQLVVAHEHPAHAVAGLLFLVVALAAFAWAAGVVQERWRSISLWVGGVLLVYAASLGILEAAVRISTASLHTDFQRGHTAVSALWGALGLALLYVGLTHGRRALRLGGFALLGVSLGKLFLYDLSQLSPITRALSFLAVGAVVLLAGFFTQRLTAQLGDRDGPPAYS